MISNVKIRGLHDLYSYDLTFNSENKVNIITGPNGYGKTTILKIISHLLECKFWYFYFIQFNNIIVSFKDGSRIVIEKISEKRRSQDELEASDIERTNEFINIIFYAANSTFEVENIVLKSNYFARLYRRYGEHSSFFMSQEPKYELEDILEREYKLEDDIYLSDVGGNIQLFLHEKSCLFIHEQRLLTDIDQPFSLSLKTYEAKRYKIQLIADDLKQRFLKNQKNFALKSQEIDATFIDRLINKSFVSYPVEVFEQKLLKLKEKIKLYGRFGLSPIIKIPEGYPEELQKVLSLYIDDMENKLSVFDDFYTKLSLYNNFLLNNALSDKFVHLDSSCGIKVINSKDEIVPLAKLSSGEQNLLILYYEMIFSIKRNSLLLIDEPENSLHVEWLGNMLEDYQKMAIAMNCQFIVATHSPVFVHGKWNITNDLFDNNKENG